jgi:UDP-2,3-diacylglucosamine hydrolase
LGKTYFASDFHLGIDGRLSSRQREQQMVRWLDGIRHDAEAIYLVGDIFDFWFEYRTVIPKGYVRLFGKLAELSDAGIPIHFFTGNHDLWMFDYFPKELGVSVHTQPIQATIHGKHFFIGHGDGLGPGDKGYKLLKKVFTNRLCQWLFARVHPNVGIGLADFFSGRSRAANPGESDFLGVEKEWLLQYALRKSAQLPAVDYFIFGHRHLPINYGLTNGRSRYINLGEWINYNSYAVFDGEKVSLHFFENPEAERYLIS